VKQKLVLFIPAIIWFIITVILLTLPGTQFPDTSAFKIPQQDKFIHFVVFFLIVFLFCRPFKNLEFSFTSKRTWFFSIALIGLIYGIAIEYIQKYYVANRSFELWDIVADGVGCFAAYFYSLKYFTIRL
jgi:VanZ family protein